VPERALLLTVRRSNTYQLARWMDLRRTAPDLDWTATSASRAERPLFCAVCQAGLVTAENCPTRRSPGRSSRRR
jgi:hypothetical protein